MHVHLQDLYDVINRANKIGAKGESKDAQKALDGFLAEDWKATKVELEESSTGDDIFRYQAALKQAKQFDKPHGLSKEDEKYYDDLLETWKAQNKATKELERCGKLGIEGISKLKKAIKEAKATNESV